MKKSYLTNVLEQLSEKDIYSLVLFVLYKLKDNKEYSTLSELVYTIDRDSLFKFLSVFGGLTIKVPTLSDLKLIVQGLLVYQLANIEEQDLTTALDEVYTGEYTKEELKNTYLKVCEVVKDYEFKV